MAKCADAACPLIQCGCHDGEGDGKRRRPNPHTWARQFLRTLYIEQHFSARAWRVLCTTTGCLACNMLNISDTQTARRQTASGTRHAQTHTTDAHVCQLNAVVPHWKWGIRAGPEVWLSFSISGKMWRTSVSADLFFRSGHYEYAGVADATILTRQRHPGRRNTFR